MLSSGEQGHPLSLCVTPLPGQVSRTKHSLNSTGETSDVGSLTAEEDLETGPPHLFTIQQEEGEERAETGSQQGWGRIQSARLHPNRDAQDLGEVGGGF